MSVLHHIHTMDAWGQRPALRHHHLSCCRYFCCCCEPNCLLERHTVCPKTFTNISFAHVVRLSFRHVLCRRPPVLVPATLSRLESTSPTPVPTIPDSCTEANPSFRWNPETGLNGRLCECIPCALRSYRSHSSRRTLTYRVDYMYVAMICFPCVWSGVTSWERLPSSVQPHYSWLTHSSVR